MTYIDREGREQHPVMGCYGIGVGRLAAACLLYTSVAGRRLRDVENILNHVAQPLGFLRDDLDVIHDVRRQVRLCLLYTSRCV